MDDDPIIIVSADYQLHPKSGSAMPPTADEGGDVDAIKGLLISKPMN
jgi:hypothetical protein